MNTKLVTITGLLLAAVPAWATIPVIDYTAIGQAIKQGLTQIQQYANEVSQLQTQIETYKNQLLQATGIAPAAQIWSEAQQTLGQVTGQVNMFRNGGVLQGYIQNAQNLNYWLASMPTEQTAGQSANYWSSTQQSANNQMVQQLATEEAQLQADAQTLQRLQTQAPTLQTQRQALDLANEMAGLQQKSLLAIRTLLVSEQQAVAARSGSTTNQDAMIQAATKKEFQANLTTEPITGWHP